MPHSRRLYEMIPIYAQLADELGVLQHFCDIGIQPQLDIFYNIIKIQEFLYDPDSPAANPHLDWLGQFVGLGKIEDHYLGIGINPLWDNSDKRNLINNAWKYWQYKGTEKGIRLAIKLWLLWERSNEPRILEIKQPLGRFPCQEPPNWVTYGTRYNHFRTQSVKDLQRQGWGDSPRLYQPKYKIFKKRVTDFYGDCYGDLSLRMESPKKRLDFARQGTFYPWMHFNELDENEWHKIFPDILELNPEIWIAPAIPTVVGWFHFPAKEIKLRQEFPPEPPQKKRLFDCDGVHYNDRFQPLIVKRKESKIISQKKWTFWDKSCHYGDAWGWPSLTQIPTPSPPLMLCYYGDFYGTATRGFERKRTSHSQSARFYYGAGVLTQRVDTEVLSCQPGIWLERPSTTHEATWIDGQALTFKSVKKTDTPKEFNLVHSSTLWGEKYFNQQANLPKINTPEKEQVIVSAIQPFVFWNSVGLCNYFDLNQGTIKRIVNQETERIQLCHQTRRYSTRTLTLVSEVNIPSNQRPLWEMYPLLKTASDSENWSCNISTGLGWLVAPAISLIALADPDWANAKRSTSISSKFPYLLVEFLIKPEKDTIIHSLTAQLNGYPVESKCFDKPIFMSSRAEFGIRLLLRFTAFDF